MSGKYKAVILAIVLLAVLAVILVPQPGRFEGEQSAVSREDSFSADPNKDPYQDYLAARRDQKPILLEFYARW